MSLHDLETISPANYGKSLTGLGVNLLVADVLREVDFLISVFSMRAYRVSQDFAIMAWQESTFMLHADATYNSHPYAELLLEQSPRGSGAELHLYNEDPDQAQIKAHDQTDKLGCMVLQAVSDKPHGLREAYILSPSGYCWVPSVPAKASS